MRIDRATIHLAGVAPDLLEQLGARRHLSTPLEQRNEQLVLFGPKQHRLAMPSHQVRSRIDFYIAERYGRIEPRLRLRARRTAKQRVDAREQLEQSEWLRNVVVGAEVKP